MRRAVLAATVLLGAALVRPDAAAGQASFAAPTLAVAVDPRVELLAMLFRAAGREEYRLGGVPRWLAAADAHVAAHADHPAVAFTGRLAGPYRVGFFVPMNLAVHLSPPPALRERVPLAPGGSLHRTWVGLPDSTRAYVAQLRDFVRASDYEAWFAAQRALVDSTEARARRAAAEIELAWFSRFWQREPGARFHLAPSLVTGRASYGVHVTADGARELHAILGVDSVDASGLPVFGPSFVPTVAHEFNHAYVDDLVDQHAAALRPAAESLYVRAAADMRRQGYGSWDSMLRETLVRAAVVRYLHAHRGTDAAHAELEAQRRLGYAWLPALDALLAAYERAGDRRGGVDALVPRIAAVLRDHAAAR